MDWFAWCIAGLLALKLGTRLALENLNRRHVLAHAGSVPEPFKEMIDETAYRRSVNYTLARNRFRQAELGWDAAVLAAALFTAVLPAVFGAWQTATGTSTLATAGFLLVVGVALSAMDLPFSWYSQFRLEERFGFNTSTQATWWLDRAKGLALSIALGLPLLALVLTLSSGPARIGGCSRGVR